MFTKILALTLLTAATYCQDHHGNNFTLNSVVTDDVPIYHQATPLNINTQKFLPLDNPKRLPLIPHEPAPVYESQEPLRAPVQLNIVKLPTIHSPTQHRVIQTVQQIPVKPVVNQIVTITPASPLVNQIYAVPIVHRIPVSPVTHQGFPVQNHFISINRKPSIHSHIVEDVHSTVIAESPRAPVRYHENHEQIGQEEQRHEEPNQIHHHGQHVDYYAYPKYDFSYEVKDPHTHDQKYQHESRDGDFVKGIYSLHEPDGSVRTVKYGSDEKAGFHAQVLHKGHGQHVIPHHSH